MALELRKSGEQLSYGAKTYTITRNYDRHGNLSRLTYPDGVAVDLAPNALGEPTRVGNYANAIRYYPTGAVASFTYGNGITHSMTPNVRGLPQRTIDTGVINDAYTYDANGNVQSITDAQLNSANRTMGYDNLDRLRSVSAPGLWGTATYTYDALDNLTSSTVSAGPKVRTMTHTYDAATNRLASLTGSAAYSTTFGYDLRGNIKQRGTQVFSFDYANRMRSATGKGTYDYDGFGRRVSVVGTDGVNRIQVYSRDAQLMFAGVSSAPVTSGVKYIYLGNHILAEVSAGGVQYNHTDGLGSPVARTDGNRAIVGGYTRYEPYGLIAAGPAGTLGFTGHVNATDVGLVYMQQRYYDPVAGRMLSVDPINADTSVGRAFNRYVYAANNPFTFVDPDGREERSLDKRDKQIEDDLKKERERCNVNCSVVTYGSYDPRDVRGGFDAYGNSLVYSPQNYDPNRAAEILIGTFAAVAAPESGLLRVGAQFSLVFKTSHYASRLRAVGLSVKATERLVGREVRSFAKELAPNADVVGRVRLKDITVEYRARLLPGDVINIGTIFPVK